MATPTPNPETGGPSAGSRELRREVERRRTFAIISHPDAGKTTLTEKLLLFGGALREAGAVRARKAARHATSDWLELEKQRGISVSSSVLHFDYEGYRVNILDTPGHRDFSEDTYRTLMAADSAVMLIDAAKGVEPQTRKLFEVCRMRQIPIFTFVNKLDRYGRDPLELMDEIEKVLGIDAIPVNWPIGAGSSFRGVYDRLGRRALLFSGGNHGTTRPEQDEVPGAPEEIRDALGETADEVLEGLELLDGAGAEVDLQRVRAGKQTPMFFGSALSNYGVLPFLESFLRMSQCPGARESTKGAVDPVTEPFSGFVFKIQANMDPDHRDRLAFLRVCSGRFEKGMSVRHARTGKTLRLANSTLLMGKDRAEMAEAFAGDVIGLFDPGLFRIGDTLCADGELHYPGIPSFPPEVFMRVDVAGAPKRKALAKGTEQLVQEGAIQLFQEEPGAGSAAMILGAMGPLQFEVMTHRLEREYKVQLRLVKLSFTAARWVGSGFDPNAFRYSETTKLVYDRDDRPVLLFANAWGIQSMGRLHPDLELLTVASG
jgi:peptide chain release factor 3